tara:strand:+ start:22069 stop:23541 length:1473 start_codon:yes stop_codon:yes gene_type:complete
MAGGGKVRITDNDLSEVAEVVNGRLLVSSTGGGGGGGDVNIIEYGGVAVGPANPIDITGAVTIQEPLSVDDNGGSLTVDGTVAVSNFPATQTVDQSTHASLNATVRLQDGDGANLLDVIQHGEVTPVSAFGTAPLMKYPSDTPAPASGAWQEMTCDDEGSLRVVQDPAGVVTVQFTTTGLSPSAVTMDAVATVTGQVGIVAGAVRNDTPSAVVSLDGDWTPLTTNSVGAMHTEPRQATHANLNSTSRIQDGDSATLCDVIPTGSATPAINGEGIANGIPAMVWVTGAPAAFQDTWNVLQISKFGRLYVTSEIESIVPGTNANNLGKQEDRAHADNDVGVMALAVRRDVAAVSSGTDGDYSTFNVDSLGRLWVRNSTFDTIALSGSTRGRPISIVATATLGTTLHVATTTAGELDRVFIDLTNTSAVDVLVTIEFGAAGAGNEIDVTVPANTTIPAVEGMVLGGAATDTITAFADTTAVINAVGRVERIPA